MVNVMYMYVYINVCCIFYFSGSQTQRWNYSHRSLFKRGKNICQCTPCEIIVITIINMMNKEFISKVVLVRLTRYTRSINLLIWIFSEPSWIYKVLKLVIIRNLNTLNTFFKRNYFGFMKRCNLITFIIFR